MLLDFHPQDDKRDYVLLAIVMWLVDAAFLWRLQQQGPDGCGFDFFGDEDTVFVSAFKPTFCFLNFMFWVVSALVSAILVALFVVAGI